ncbi:MAG: Rieske (2Fe-2S) protein [Proteobacteria bacterium]|nr:Rieske (2Fe-2S) protein [Pseudomonadota bacterium]
MSGERQLICGLDDIEDGESAGGKADIGGRERSLVLVRKGEIVFAYINSCPHIGAPLELRPGYFLTLDRSHINCVNHGAHFRIEDGYCVQGPCIGQSLKPVDALIEDGKVYVQG